MPSADAKRRREEGSLRPETVKHYLETIFYVSSEEGRVRPGRIADWLGVRPPTVSDTLRRLERDGWIQIAPDRTVALTRRGLEEASRVVRIHRLLERWLTDVLGFDWASADDLAQQIAPGFPGTVADRLDEHLGHPSTCPHGNLIPGRKQPYGKLTALSDLRAGTPARIRRISEVTEHEAPDLLRRLDAHGLVTGAEVAVVEETSSHDAITVASGGRTIALGLGTAASIWVEPFGSSAISS